eukprot:CAMPEP_0201521180 /NCGR_PEP_ID=MMETSP0161_2-20130828/14259_1 /ASSEMBLY_ACC=CAM_ASM_000251 /TAXON_ID=180227 /ORGANISM="Neoparamoeba aestuarina, Strain SoJaBio B1-5/56/2" /LENGTH=100 /DNA_ID=CAMNT_0047919769 /DNA_START=75 /DNA_END=377 /DNA_ORIENTATION=-
MNFLSASVVRSGFVGMRMMSSSSAALARQNGTVIWFDAPKGYGFLKPEGDDNTNIFVHYTGIRGSGFRSLEAEMKVEFDVVEVEGKNRAVDVVIQGEDQE